MHADDKARMIDTMTQDTRKLYWDLFVGLMIVHSVIVIPWRIAFQQDASGGMLYFDFCVDAFFGMDMLVYFNSAYFQEVRSVSSRRQHILYDVCGDANVYSTLPEEATPRAIEFNVVVDVQAQEYRLFALGANSAA